MSTYCMELDLLPVIIPPELHYDLPMFTEAIEAVRAHDGDRVIIDHDGEPFMRAFQVVRLFDLGGFVKLR